MTEERQGKAPLVSVLIAAYNAQDTLPETLDSALSQDYGNFEVLVVDDASTDRTPDILAEYQARHGNLRVLRNERNLGFSRTRNRLLREMRRDTEFLAVLDSDDLAEPGRLSAQAACLQEHGDLQAVGSDALIIDGSGAVTAVRVYPHSPEETMAEAPVSNPVMHSALMVRRSAADKAGFYDESLGCCEDYDYVLRLMDQGGVANLDRPLARYRVSPGQHTSRRTREMLLTTLKIQGRRLFSPGFLSFEALVLYLAKCLLLLLPSRAISWLFRRTAYSRPGAAGPDRGAPGPGAWTGLAYICLMALHIPLGGRFFAEDLLVPFMAWAVLTTSSV